MPMKPKVFIGIIEPKVSMIKFWENNIKEVRVIFLLLLVFCQYY